MIWFAALQAVSPFIHGHLGADSSAQGHGLHMHLQESAPVYDAVHTLKSADAPVHIIGVDKALVKVSDLLPAPLFAVLFVLFLAAALSKFQLPSFSPVLRRPLYLRTQSRPRAPPFF